MAKWELPKFEDPNHELSVRDEIALSVLTSILNNNILAAKATDKNLEGHINAAFNVADLFLKIRSEKN